MDEPCLFHFWPGIGYLLRNCWDGIAVGFLGNGGLHQPHAAKVDPWKNLMFHHFEWVNHGESTNYAWPCSIAMLNYQRVTQLFYLYIYIYTWGKPLGGLTRNHPCMGHGLWVDLTIVRNELYLLGDSTWLIHHPVTPGSPGIAFFPWSIRLGGIVRQNCGLLGIWPFNKKKWEKDRECEHCSFGVSFFITTIQSNSCFFFFEARYSKDS